MPGSAMSLRRTASVGAASSRSAGSVRTRRASVPARRGESPHRAARGRAQAPRAPTPPGGTRSPSCRSATAASTRRSIRAASTAGTSWPASARTSDWANVRAARRPQGADGAARAAPGADRRCCQPQERRVVDVRREHEPQAIDRGVGVGRGEAHAERPVAPLPDARPSRPGRGAERNLEDAAAQAARRVAPSGRVGEAVRARRGELELDHACSITRWSPTTTPERSIAPTGAPARPSHPGTPTCATAGSRGRASGRARRLSA